MTGKTQGLKEGLRGQHLELALGSQEARPPSSINTWRIPEPFEPAWVPPAIAGASPDSLGGQHFPLSIRLLCDTCGDHVDHTWTERP